MQRPLTRGGSFFFVWLALSLPLILYAFTRTGGGTTAGVAPANFVAAAPSSVPLKDSAGGSVPLKDSAPPAESLRGTPPPLQRLGHSTRVADTTPASCVADAAAPLAPGAASPSVPLWKLAPPGLPIRERRFLIALDAQLPLALRCATSPARILIAGLGGCATSRDYTAALNSARVLRLAAPWVDLVIEDVACNEAAAAAVASMGATATSGAAGGDFDALILRRGDDGDAGARATAAFGRIRDGGVLILEGFSDVVNGQQELTKSLNSVKWGMHCAANGCSWNPQLFGSGPIFMARAKAVDCVRDWCAVYTWSRAEKASQSSDGVKALISRAPQVVSARALERSANKCTPERQDSVLFWTLGLVAGTDKVYNPDARGNTHYYHEPYARHFGPRRCGIASVLEIGLGCDMHYDPGAAFSPYLDYFPFAHIAYMEYDATCVDKFNREDPKRLTATHGRERWSLVAGDQRNAAHLLAVSAPRGGADWDIVIDDGGHSMGMQVTSLRVLLPHVSPGGFYVLEDFHTSWIEWVAKDGQGGVLTTDYVDEIAALLHNPTSTLPTNLNPAQFDGVVELAALTKALSCSPQVCIFTRWTEDERKFLEE